MARKVRKPRGGYTYRWVHAQWTRAAYTLYRNFPMADLAPTFDAPVPFEAPRIDTEPCQSRTAIRLEQQQGKRPHMEGVAFTRTWHVNDRQHHIFALRVLNGHRGNATSCALHKMLPKCIAYNLGDDADLNDAFWQAQRQLNTELHSRHRG
jgi:hypothetical protein